MDTPASGIDCEYPEKFAPYGVVVNNSLLRIWTSTEIYVYSSVRGFLAEP